MGRVEARLKDLQIVLPPVPKPVANFLPAKRAGNLVFTAGQVSTVGEQVYKGALKSEQDVPRGRDATRTCALNCLAALLSVIRSLDEVKQIVHVGGLVNSADGFEGQAAVMNGASEFLVDAFGEAGKHTRTAAGVRLPLDYTASVWLIAEV